MKYLVAGLAVLSLLALGLMFTDMERGSETVDTEIDDGPDAFLSIKQARRPPASLEKGRRQKPKKNSTMPEPKDNKTEPMKNETHSNEPSHPKHPEHHEHPEHPEHNASNPFY